MATQVAGACIFEPCVATWRHWHYGFPGSYDDPADPDGAPIPFEGDEPAEGVRDYNGAPLRYTRAPKTEWCWFCRRAVVSDDADSRTVTLPDGSEGVLCGPCIDKADVGPDVRLDYMEGDDDDREGQPEFNGAFGG